MGNTNTYTPVSKAEYAAHHGELRNGARILMDTILFCMNAAGKRVTNMGIVNDRNVRGGGVKSTHAVGRGGDVGVPSRDMGNELFLRLIAGAEAAGIDEVIFWRKRWTPDKGVRNYFGINPHKDHVHWAIDPKVADYAGPDSALTAWFAAAIFRI